VSGRDASARPAEGVDLDHVAEDAAPEDPAPDDDAYDYEAGSETTVVARTVVRFVVPITLVTAVALLLQGHNLPGGGFIGAVLTAAAVTLIYVIFGLDYVRTAVLGSPRFGDPDDLAVSIYRWMFGLGLALAATSGLAPILFGYEFLTQAVVFVEHVPLYGELEFASALAFDLGVYFTVVGALLTIVAEVGAE